MENVQRKQGPCHWDRILVLTRIPDPREARQLLADLWPKCVLLLTREGPPREFPRRSSRELWQQFGRIVIASRFVCRDVAIVLRGEAQPGFVPHRQVHVLDPQECDVLLVRSSYASTEVRYTWNDVMTVRVGEGPAPSPLALRRYDAPMQSILVRRVSSNLSLRKGELIGTLGHENGEVYLTPREDVMIGTLLDLDGDSRRIEILRGGQRHRFLVGPLRTDLEGCCASTRLPIPPGCRLKLFHGDDPDPSACYPGSAELTFEYHSLR